MPSRTPDAIRRVRFGIGERMGFLSFVLVLAISALIGWLAYRETESIVINHELVDLADETGRRKLELEREFDELRERTLRLAGAACVEQLQTLGAVPEAQTAFLECCRRLAADDRDILELCVLPADPGAPPLATVQRPPAADDLALGQPPPPLELSEQPAPRALPQADWAELPAGVARVSTVVYDAQRQRPVVYCVAFAQAEAARLAVLVTFDFQRFYRRLWRNSPRHLVFLTDNAGRLLIQPEHGRSPAVNPAAGNTHLADLVGDYRDCFDQTDGEPLERIGRRYPPASADAHFSELLPAIFPQEGRWFVMASAPVPASIEAKELTAALHRACAAQEPPVSYNASIQAGNPTYVSGRRLAQLEQVRAELTRQFPSLRLFDPVECRGLAVHFFRLRLAADDPSQYLGFAMAVSREELQADLQREVLGSLLFLVACSLAASLVAAAASRFITRRLKLVTRATQQLARGDYQVELPESGDDEVAELAGAFRTMVGQIRLRTEQLREREARTGAILATAADGILTFDDRGRIDTCNRAAAQLFGYEELSLIGRPVGMLFPSAADADPNEIPPALRIPAGSSTSLPREVEGRRRDGVALPVEVAVSRVELEGSLLTTASFRDVSERRRAAEMQLAKEAAEAANHAKDVFLASISHELRNPLNHISGYCQLLELTELDDEQLRDVQRIRAAGTHLLAIINDILDYQKIILGQMPLEHDAVDLNALLAETCEAMRPRVSENLNRLSVVGDPALQPTVTDARRVRQVLLNLLSNAAKFTRQGEVRASARRIVEGGRAWACLEIADTGRGMSAEELGRLFQPFTKLSTLAENPEGTGLGLAISRGLARRMGGDLLVGSKLGAGSQFTLRLPLTPVAADQATEAPPPQTVAPPVESAARRCVLVIDDDAQVRDLMQRFLAAQGFDVELAGTGTQGLEAAKRRRPDVITLDAVMPGIDGWATLAALKTDAETAEIPVIMVTMLDDTSRGYALGATDYVTKPVDWSRLAGLLGRYAQRHETASVLVVDDDPATREMLRRMLASDGWNVVEAEHGRAALTAVAQHRPAMILLDLMMPVMDGFEFVERLRENQACANVPVLVVTAKELSPTDRLRLQGSVVQVVQKGAYTRDDLLHEIHRRVLEYLGHDHVAPR